MSLGLGGRSAFPAVGIVLDFVGIRFPYRIQGHGFVGRIAVTGLIRYVPILRGCPALEGVTRAGWFCTA